VADPERLVVCPECDDLIPEDDWDWHSRQCRPVSALVNASDNDLIDWIHRRQMRNPHWYEKHDHIRSLAEQAVDKWRMGTMRPGLPAMFPAPPQVMAMPIITNTTQPAAITATVATINVRIPNVPMDEREAFGLAMEQIYEQWEDVCMP
jgi:hypothetical protein